MDDLKTAIRKKKEPELDHLAADTHCLEWLVNPPDMCRLGDLMFGKLHALIPSTAIYTKLRHVQSPEEIPGCIKLDAFDKISNQLLSSTSIPITSISS